MNPGPAPAPTAVVGHVEWVTHADGSLPARGAIADLSQPFAEAAGGGAVAAAAIARAAPPVMLFTALGDDAAARSCADSLARRPGLQLVAAERDAPQTPVLSITEADAERTIMVVGPRLQPAGSDALGWERIARCGAAYYAGEDPATLVLARAAPVLVVTARRLCDVRDAGVRPEVIVGSASDPDEDTRGLPARLAPDWTVLTRGDGGGVVIDRSGTHTPYAAHPPPGPVVDTYGCGDTFAGCLAAYLGAGRDIGEAVAGAAAEAARCATWRGGPGPGA